MPLFSVLFAAASAAPGLFANAISNSEVPEMQEPMAVSIIPEPVQCERLEGHFRLNPDTAILAPRHESGVYGVAVYLSECLKPGFGRELKVVSKPDGSRQQNLIELTTSGADPTLGEEGYELRGTPQRITIKAPTDTGLSRGVQTLRQLLAPEFEDGKARANWDIPCVYVRDWPRYKWRGMLLDCCRHFMDKAFVKRAIDLLAYHKMNTLHWHLTEDQGWRIEIKKYPKLTQIGAYRGKEKYGGFYSQADIKEVVSYARTRHVMIVPEIEMPGHSLAAVACYPELSCTGGPFEVGTEWGVYSDVYCAGNDKTFAFLQDVLSEVMDLFPGTYVHIGGDEVPKSRWQACAKCQARIRAEGLKGEHELQSWFIRKIEAFINSRGKKLIGWDEILEGGLSPNATVQSWRGMDGGIAAAKQGHDVIMSPTSHCYLDASNENTTLQKCYSFEPTPPELSPLEAKHILGGEGNVWTEWIPQERFDRQAFPRLAALSEVYWSPKEKRNWESFSQRMAQEYVRLDGFGVRYYLPQPKFSGQDRVFTDLARLAFENPPSGADIVYTTDGTVPTAKSARYAGPVTLAESTRIRAAMLWRGKALSEEVSRTFEKQNLMPALASKFSVEPGVEFRYFQGNWSSVPDFSKLTPLQTGTAARIGLEPRKRDVEFGLEFFGFLSVPADGVYTLFLESDDGSLLFIDGKKVVDNDGAHPPIEATGQIALRKGMHAVRVGFFQAAGGLTLGVKWQGPSVSKSAIDGALLRIKNQGARRINLGP